MWSAARGAPPDHEQVLFAFGASFVPERFLAAFERLMQRHEVLRAELGRDAHGCPELRIHATLPLPHRSVDLRSLQPAEADARLKELAERELDAPFVLDEPPLYRLCLVRLPEQRWSCIWTFHHALLDAGSLREALVALLRAYAGQDAVRPLEAPPAEPAELRPESARFFGELLAGLEAPTTVHFGVAHRSFAQAAACELREELSGEELTQLQNAESTLGADFATLCEAAWALSLHHYTQTHDLLYGVNVSDGVDELTSEVRRPLSARIGPLPARLSVHAQHALGAWLAQLAAQRQERQRHADSCLQALRALAPFSPGLPLFECCLSVEPRDLFSDVTHRLSREDLAAADLCGLTHRFRSSLPLVLTITREPSKVALTLTFHTQKLDRDTAHNLLRHVARMLVAIARAHTDTELSDFSPLSDSEHRALVEGWNATDRYFPAHLRLHDLFTAQAERTPERTALVGQHGARTFAELEARANQLAHALIKRGVGHRDRVAVCLPRSFDLVATLLAVSKAGASYVPLDRAHPEERLRFMLGDAGARLLVTAQTERPEGLAKEDLGCAELDLDLDAGFIARCPTSAPHCPSSAEDEAYVIYTSGSTGKPKGVVVRHRAVANVIDWVNRSCGITSDDRLLFVTSVCFDLSVYDVFGALGAGASLYVASSEELKDPSALVHVLETRDITLWDSAPAALSQLVPFLPASGSGKLRRVLLSGDWIPVSLVGQLRAAYPELRVMSLGGATEATVWSNYYEINEVDPRWPSIPYGKPIQNARYYVLDARMRPLPVGVAGELYIGGTCVADGYLGRPELNAERFLEDPFTGIGRLYRTGDLARHMPDGNLEFLGRVDSQVKIRGFRVELGEIEAVLNQSPQVASCVVDAPQLADGQRSLVAYVVPRGERDVAALRGACRRALPEYMVPSRFVFMTELPLTPHGKLDRRALPVPQVEASSSYVAPVTPLECQLTSRFAAALGVDQVGLDDDFFELGGHSLLASQLISELMREHGVELSLPRFLAAPNVRALALHLERTEPSRAPAQRILPRPDAAPTVSFEQSRLAFVQALDPAVATYNISLGFRLQGALDPELLHKALDAVVARHEPLRTAFLPSVGGHEARILQDVNVPFAYRNLQRMPRADREQALKEAMQEVSGTPFDLTQAPLLRAMLVKLGREEHALLIAVHHIVFDGPSGAILMRELLAHYDALVKGSLAELPPLALRFNDVALHQQQRLAQSDHAADLAYWRARLAGPLPILQLPHDHPRPTVFSFRGGVHGFRLSPEESGALRRLAQKNQASVFTLLLSAFSTLLHRYSGQPDVLVAIPVAMRDQQETQNLIGLLLNTLVIRSELAAGTTFAELLATIKQRFLEALEHRELPFERLVADLNPPRDPALTPVFQAFFSYEETSGREAISEHLSVSRMVVDQLFAGTDLSLFVEDDPKEGIHGYFEYSSDLFEPHTIAVISEGFLRLLAALPGHAEAPVRELPVLSERERSQQITRWNQTDLPLNPERGLIARFEEMSRRHGKKPAVHFQGTSLSYRDLRAGVHLLAGALRVHGVGPGCGVAVMLDRSPRLLMTLLAILKTGAYYIPLDPAHPQARNQRVLETAEPSLVIIEDATRGSLPASAAGEIYNLDAPRQHADAHPFVLSSTIDPESLAYVIFTSGSTGAPKGVEITHSALSNLLCSMALRPGFGAQDRLLSITTVSFDIAALELFLPLVTGGSVEIAPRELALDPDALVAQLRLATVFQATPATFRMLLERGLPRLPNLRLLCGGETLSLDLALALRERVESLWNMYGPTETTIWSSVEEVPRDASVITIGQPIHNTRIYVLDDALNPVPPGVVGQLYIGGVGVARGYHRQPELTERAFLPDPFDPRPGARLYRTGDLGRRLPDGRLLCLGRTDFQVKIRGYRVELGEIEAALLAHPQVREAVVHAKTEPAQQDPRVLAYVVLEESAQALPTDLFESLRGRLPHYMLPTHVTALAALPLTPNGKVDKKALPEPSACDATRFAERAAESASSDVELAVSRIVSKHLGVHAVSPHANFFELGGHSLLAVRVVRELNEVFGLSLAIGMLFQAPTVAGLAAAVMSRGGKLSSAVVPLARGSQEAPLYFICGIQLYHQLAQNLRDQTSYGIFVQDEQAFLESSGNVRGASIPRLAAAYVEAIRKHSPQGPFALAGVSFGGLLAYEVARQLRAAGHEVSLLVLLDSVLPCALQSRPGKRLRHALKRLAREPATVLVERAQGSLRALRARGWGLAAAEPEPVDNRPELLWRAYSGAAANDYFASRPTYEGPTLIVRAGDRSDLVGVDLAPDLGWGRYLTGPVQLAVASGDHLGILRTPETAELLREHLSLWRAPSVQAGGSAREQSEEESVSPRTGSPRQPSSCP